MDLAIMNPFSANPAFELASLTAAINILPNNYGRLREKNLFPGEGIFTRTALVEEQNGVLNLLQTQPLGADGQNVPKSKQGKRNMRSFVIPHIPLEDQLLPQEYANVRAFGTTGAVNPYVTIVNNKLQVSRNKHAITLEWLRMGALKGLILDADGSTLYNLYTEFGVVQKTVNFALNVATTDVGAKCREVVRHIEDSLQGEVMNKIECLVSAEFFDALISHPLVKEVYLGWQKSQEVLGADVRKGFTFQGITFEEYNGISSDAAGTARRFIAAGDGHCYPVGTMETFKTFYAPGSFLETANTQGLEIYAKMEARKFNKGMDIYTESNPLPICLRPKLLVRVHKQ